MLRLKVGYRSPLVLALSTGLLLACGGLFSGGTEQGSAGDCSDGEDNDGDGKTDAEDPECATGPGELNPDIRLKGLEAKLDVGYFKDRWSTSTPPVQDLVLAPWGDVVVVGRDEVRVLARDTGESLEVAAACQSVPDGAAFIDDTRLALTCEDGVYVMTLPGGAIERVVTGPMLAGAYGGGLFATANPQGTAVFTVSNWELAPDVATGKATSVAVSDDGAWIAHTSEKIGLWLSYEGKHQLPFGTPDWTVEAMHFSPGSETLIFSANGAVVFLDLPEMSVATVCSLDGKTLASMAGYNAYAFFASGTAGLNALAGGKQSCLALDKPDAISDGPVTSAEGTVCASERSGGVRCYTREEPAPSTYGR